MTLRLITTQLNGSKFIKTMDQLFGSFRKIRNRATLGVLVLAFIFYVSSSQKISDLERVKLSGELLMLLYPAQPLILRMEKVKMDLITLLLTSLQRVST